MRNSNSIIRTFLILVLAFNTMFSCAEAQLENPEEVITVAQGYSLKAKHAVTVMQYLQSQGSLSQNPSSQEIEPILTYLVDAFTADPAGTLDAIRNNMSGAQQQITHPPTQAPIQTAPANHAQQAGGIYNQAQAETEIAKTYKRHYPNAVIDYTHPQAKQLKASLGGVLLVTNNSKTYNSGSGDNYFGMTTASSMNMHFCPNGVITIQSSSRSMGGGYGSSIDSGDSGDAVQGWWSVAVVNNQLCIMTGDYQGVDATPIYLETDSIIMWDKRFTAHQGQAQCGM